MSQLKTRNLEHQSFASLLEKSRQTDSFFATTEDLIGAFEGGIRRPSTSIFYKFALLLLAIAMITLPLIYAGMVALVGYGVYLYAVKNLSILNGDVHLLYALLIYFTPLLSGVLVIFFLIKPFLAKPAFEVPPRALRPEEQPLLHAFVRKLCEIVRAPVPRQIQVNCEVNAGASLKRGIFGVFSRDLNLIIGLPLVSEMNLRQLTGVLAHEFGHFSQGGAMRLRHLIMHINYWFHHVVYERDTWDEQIKRWISESDIRLKLIFLLTVLCVWIGRKVLWVLMYLEHMLSCYMSRQMQYNADSYEARVAGSSAFEGTFARLTLLSVATELENNDLNHAWEERRLGDDLPALVVANLEKMPPDLKEKALQESLNGKTRLFDTHPSDARRIRQVKKEQSPGIFHDERPASVLFNAFESLFRTASMDLYSQMLGVRVAHSQLVPTRELVGHQQAMKEEYETISRFFHDRILPDRPLNIAFDFTQKADDPRAAADAVRKARERFAQATESAGTAYELYKEAIQAEIKAFMAKELIDAGIKFKPAKFGLRKAKPAEAQSAIEKARQIRDEAEMQILPLEDAMKKRISAAVALLQFPQVRQRVENGETLLKQIARIIDALNSYESLRDAIESLRWNQMLVDYLLSIVEKHKKDEYFFKKKAASKRSRQLIDRIVSGLNSTPYPVPHGHDAASLGQYLLGTAILSDDIGEIHQKANETLERLHKFYYRALGALGKAAEGVERAAGLPPIRKPIAEKVEHQI